MTDHMYIPSRNSCHEVYHSYFWKMKIHEKAKLQVEMTRLAWKTESRLPSLSWFLTQNITSSSPKWWQRGFQRGFQRATRLPNHSTYGSETWKKVLSDWLLTIVTPQLPTSCFLTPTNTVFAMGMEADSTYEWMKWYFLYLKKIPQDS